VCIRLCRGVGVIESLEDLGTKAQEGHCFRCTELRLQGVQRWKNYLEEFKVYKISGGIASWNNAGEA